MNAALTGAAAGVAATGTMTAFLETAKGLGFLSVEPPKQITAAVEQKTGMHVAPSDDFTARWLSAHTAFGAGAGLVFGLARRALPKSSAAAGLLYGGAVWASMYPLALPLAGLYPKPEDDSEPRAWSIAIAHLVYGVSLALAYDAGQRAKDRGQRKR
jgi:uncharacterized membrane protein YagU involved in acid resistance